MCIYLWGKEGLSSPLAQVHARAWPPLAIHSLLSRLPSYRRQEDLVSLRGAALQDLVQQQAGQEGLLEGRGVPSGCCGGLQARDGPRAQAPSMLQCQGADTAVNPILQMKVKAKR